MLSVSELELEAVPTVEKTDEVSKTVLITSVEDVKVVIVLAAVEEIVKLE